MWNDAHLQNWIISDSTASDSVKRLLGRMGFDLAWSEGSAFVDPNAKTLLELIGSLLTPAMRDFLILRQKEESEGFSDDAALRITWDQLGNRVATWERFLATHSTFVLRDEAQGRYQLYLETYLTGMDNSRVFSLDGDSLDPRVKRSWEQFLQRYPDSRAALILRGYLGVLATNRYRLTDQVRAYLRANSIESMLGIQPPNR